MTLGIERQPSLDVGAIDFSLDKKDVDLEPHPHLEYAQNTQEQKTHAAPEIEAAMLAETEEGKMTFKTAIRDYRVAVFWSFAISLCIIMEGYDTALPGNFNGLIAFRKKYGHEIIKSDGTVDYQLTAAWQTGLGYAGGVGSILAIFATGWVQQRYGYRRVIQGGLVGMFCSIFLTFFAQNIVMLLIGYHCCGWSWGVFQASVVSYASEITPVALRGYLTTYVNLCWIIGQFLAAGVLKAMASRTDEWGFRIPFAIQWIWPIPLIALIQFAPESPWFLVRKGRYEEAAKVIVRIQKKGSTIDPNDTIAMIIRTDEHEKRISAGTTYWDCFKGTDLRRTEIACVAWASQNLCGLSFAGAFVYFLEQVGITAEQAYSFNLGSVGMAFVGTILSWVVLNKFGRRTIMLYGSLILTCLLLVIGLLTLSKTHNGKFAQAILMMLWVLIFDLSIGPLAYCIVGEVSSTRLRGLTVGLARNAYNLIGMPFGTIFNYMLNPTAWNLGGYTAFFAAGTAGLVCIWIFFRLPECKHRTYRELDILFERKISAKKFSQTKVEAWEES